MPYFVAFGSGQPAQGAGSRGRMHGAGKTPYATLAEAVEAAKQSRRDARERGITQTHVVIEAPTSEDAVMFVAGVPPPRDVAGRVFGDPSHEVTAQIVWTEADAD